MQETCFTESESNKRKHNCIVQRQRKKDGFLSLSVIEGFAILFYFVMVPVAYEANYINKLFLISFQLFDYAASRLQNFRSNKSSPESHG